MVVRYKFFSHSMLNICLFYRKKKSDEQKERNSNLKFTLKENNANFSTQLATELHFPN